MTIKQELNIVRRICRWLDQLPTCTVDFILDRALCRRLSTGKLELANVVIERK